MMLINPLINRMFQRLLVIRSFVINHKTHTFLSFILGYYCYSLTSSFPTFYELPQYVECFYGCYSTDHVLQIFSSLIDFSGQFLSDHIEVSCHMAEETVE